MVSDAEVSRAYWDAGHQAPVHPAAREALLAALDDGWADPRRLHHEGRSARLLLDGARQAVASALGYRADEVALTGSFTSAVHAGLLGTLAGRARIGHQLVHSAVEHSSVLGCAAWHARAGGSCTEIPVRATGAVEAAAFAEALSSETALAALQFANGEVGTLQPVQDVIVRCRELGIPLFVDASDAAGQVDMSMAREVSDLLVVDPGSWGSPAGLGVLCTRTGVRWRSPWPDEGDGPAHSPGAPGAVSVPLALATAVGLQAAVADQAEADRRRRAATERLRTRLPSLVSDCEVVGDPLARVPHVLTFSLLFADGETLVSELDRAGFAVGSGSACTSSTLRPSHVLAAMGVLTHGNVRVSIPATITADDLTAQVARFEQVLPDVAARIRGSLGASGL